MLIFVFAKIKGGIMKRGDGLSRKEIDLFKEIVRSHGFELDELPDGTIRWRDIASGKILDDPPESCSLTPKKSQ